MKKLYASLICIMSCTHHIQCGESPIEQSIELLNNMGSPLDQSIEIFDKQLYNMDSLKRSLELLDNPSLKQLADPLCEQLYNIGSPLSQSEEIRIEQLYNTDSTPLSKSLEMLCKQPYYEKLNDNNQTKHNRPKIVKAKKRNCLKSDETKKDCIFSSIANTFSIDKTTEPYALTQTVDTLSAKLYNHNLTEQEIDELVDEGADVNYKGSNFNTLVPESIPVYFARNKTEQGVKNMQTIIARGAQLHGNPHEWHTPLTIAVELNNFPMILLLLLYEKVETSTRSEELRREWIIHQFFVNKNINAIELLLQFKLITFDRGLQEFVHYNMTEPNQKIFDLLVKYGPYKNSPDDLYHVTRKTFFSKDFLTKMRTLKNNVNEILNALEIENKFQPF